MSLWGHSSSETLSRMLDEMLDVKEQAATRKHLATCLECEHRLRAAAKVKQALGSMPPLEGNPLEMLQPPVFVPIIRPAFPLLGFVIGLIAGLVLLAGFLSLRPMHTPMKIISAPTALIASEGPGKTELEPGEAVNTLVPGDVDLEIPHQVLLRLKPGTTMSWEERNRAWLFGGRPNIVLNVMRGEVLARTQDRFWGSHLAIRTPTAIAMVKGTALSVKVEPDQDATTLKVLAGQVFFSPYLDKVGMNVRSGQTSQIQGKRLPSPAQALSPAERKQLLDTYRIGLDPTAALVVGGGPERVEELLQPALLFLSFNHHPGLQPFIRNLVEELNAALLEGGLSSQVNRVQALEVAVVGISDPGLAVPLRMYVGACEISLGKVLRGRSHFHWVMDRNPQHPQASLALAALGVTAEKQLHNPELAQAAFQQLLSQYPRSPEVSLAREFLSRYSRPSRGN